jgi:hypothetical protein
MRINKHLENGLKLAMTLFYLGLGGWSLATGAPLEAEWLAWKAFLFGLIFLAAIISTCASSRSARCSSGGLPRGQTTPDRVAASGSHEPHPRWVLTSTCCCSAPPGSAM